jgi:hypothetical protein
MNIEVDENQDLVVRDGDLSLITGITEIQQLVADTLRSFQGDWFLDLDLGLPYYQTIFRKATSISDIEGIFLDAITSVPGILDITKFDLEFDAKNRTLNVVFTARTTDGILNFNLAEV